MQAGAAKVLLSVEHSFTFFENHKADQSSGRKKKGGGGGVRDAASDLFSRLVWQATSGDDYDQTSPLHRLMIARDLEGVPQPLQDQCFY